MAEDTVYEEEMKCHNVTRVRKALIKVWHRRLRRTITINSCTFLTLTVDVHDPLRNRVRTEGGEDEQWAIRSLKNHICY